MSYLEARLLNHPIKLYWEGWETSADILKRIGWDIKIEQLTYQHAYRIVGKHPYLDLYMIGDPLSMTLLEQMSYRHLSSNYSEVTCKINLATCINAIVRSDPSPIVANYGYPIMTDEPINDFSVRDFFKETKSKESSILTPDDIPDLLSKIIELQTPKQKEINKKLMQRDAKIEPVIQILKVA